MATETDYFKIAAEFDAAKEKRARDMVKRHKHGESLAKIAQSYGMSRQRVRQIINKAQREGF